MTDEPCTNPPEALETPILDVRDVLLRQAVVPNVLGRLRPDAKKITVAAFNSSL